MASKVIKLPEGFSPEGRGDLAKSFFLQGYNCCQAVLLAFADILEADGSCDRKTLAILGSGFGGGMARMREVCGSFSACTVLAGFIRPATSPGIEERKANYALVQEMAETFRERNGGSIVCRELLGLQGRGPEGPQPSVRTADFYRKRPCGEIIRNAAVIAAEKMKEAAR